MSKAKKIVVLIFLSFLLLLNILGTYVYFRERFITRSIVSKDVVIVDKYKVGGDIPNASSLTYYMKGKDKNDEIFLIMGNKCNVGDSVTIYTNENSVQAKSDGTASKWHTSVNSVDATSDFKIVFFAIFSVINICFIVCYIKKPADNSTKPTS